jgi:deoxycytidine triphosphate deaminase
MRILRGEDIKRLGAEGIIIREKFRSANCEGVSYNLTLGNRVQSISRTEQGYRAIQGALVLGPSESVNVEINEKFNFADKEGRPRYFGLILASARLLAGGVSHPATIIDPGARHATTLTLVNLRNFPSRSFRPGSDSIAKLVVIDLGLEELPVAWDATPAYAQAGAEELPVLWSDFHLMPKWAPILRPEAAELEGLASTYGPPFDILASYISQYLDQLVDDAGRPISVRELVRSFNYGNDRQDELRDLLARRIEALERDQATVDARVSGVAKSLAELYEARLADRAKASEERRESRRYFVATLVAIGAAILGAVATVLLSRYVFH